MLGIANNLTWLLCMFLGKIQYPARNTGLLRKRRFSAENRLCTENIEVLSNKSSIIFIERDELNEYEAPNISKRSGSKGSSPALGMNFNLELSGSETGRVRIEVKYPYEDEDGGVLDINFPAEGDGQEEVDDFILGVKKGLDHIKSVPLHKIPTTD